MREGGRFLTQLWRLRLGEFSTRVGRFGVVGVTGLLVNTIVLAALADLAGLYYVAAAVLATQVSTLWNFTLTELWVFADRSHRLRGVRRLVTFYAVNNIALALRVPVLIALTSGLGIHYVVSNLITLVLVFVARFTLADLWIWAKSDALAAQVAAHNYDIHGLVSVASQVALPELERFRVAEPLAAPPCTYASGRCDGDPGRAPRTARPRRASHTSRAAVAGFGTVIQMGERTEVLASPLLKRSPHVLYTNVVEPILRWTFAEMGYALVHAACIAHEGRAYLITARTDTGKTTTCLKTLDGRAYSFLSDDLTLLSPEGRVLPYPKPLTISRHTLRAVNRPLQSRRERMMLVYQSRLHSRSGRRFAMVLAKTHMPAATINTIVQLLVPPPKYQVDRLVPDVRIAPEATLAGVIVIQRGGEGHAQLSGEEALEILSQTARMPRASRRTRRSSISSTVATGPTCAPLSAERLRARCVRTATLLKSETMDWYLRVVALVDVWRPPGGARVIPTTRPVATVRDGRGGVRKARFCGRRSSRKAEARLLSPRPVRALLR